MVLPHPTPPYMYSPRVPTGRVCMSRAPLPPRPLLLLLLPLLVRRLLSPENLGRLMVGVGCGQGQAGQQVNRVVCMC